MKRNGTFIFLVLLLGASAGGWFYMQPSSSTAPTDASGNAAKTAGLRQIQSEANTAKSAPADGETKPGIRPEYLAVPASHSQKVFARAPVTPRGLPELPMVFPLEAAPTGTLPRVKTTDNPKYDHYSIPQEVIDNFTMETGITAEEIESAMRR